MKKKLLPAALVAFLVLVGALGFVAYAVFRPPEEASAPIEAIPLDDTDTAPTTAAEAPDTTNTNDESDTTDEESPDADATIFEIVQDESHARFLIDEVLRGDPVTVEGTTDQVAGQVSFNFDDLSEARVGIIQINARTLTTDNEYRNRAIKNRILFTDDFEFVRFEPTEISGLPDSAEPGETYTFEIIGNLTVTDETHPVTFDVSVTMVSDTRIEGSASTTIEYADFNLAIPEVPAVDTVEDEVRLELDFAAVANEE